MCILAIDVLLRMHLDVHDVLSSECLVETIQVVTDLMTVQCCCAAPKSFQIL